jgi:hypothetical protein
VDYVREYFAMLDFSKEYFATMDLVRKYSYQVEKSLIKYSIDVSKIYYKIFSLAHVHSHMLTK